MLVEPLVEPAVVIDGAQQLLDFVVQVFFFQLQGFAFGLEGFPRLDKIDLFEPQSNLLLFKLRAKLDANSPELLLDRSSQPLQSAVGFSNTLPDPIEIPSSESFLSLFEQRLRIR